MWVLRIYNKLIIGFCILILLAINMAWAQTTYQPAKIHDVAVTLISQEPDPAEPGKYVDVRFKFDNNGSGEAKDVEAEILPEYPFSLDKGVDSTKRIGTLQSMQRGDVGAIAKYRLRVDENAVEGENDIKIRYRLNKESWIQPDPFKIKIQTHDAILSVDDVSVDKDMLEPGSSSVVKIKVSNKADSILQDVKARLELGGLPFAPVGSTNEKSIYKIDAKENYEFDFKILVNPEAKSGVYQVPLKIAYSDDLGKNYIRNGTIGLIIGAKPDLSVTLDSYGVFESIGSGQIVFKVVNKGVTDIKFMNVKLIAGEGYTILSSDESYLGNIDSDDYETADFKLFIKKSKKKEIMLPFVLEYKDANNNNFKEKVELPLKVYSTSEAKKLGLIKGNGKVGFVIIIVVVIAGLLVYRKWRKARKKKA